MTSPCRICGGAAPPTGTFTSTLNRPIDRSVSTIMDLSTLDRARLALMLRRDPSELPEHDGRTTIDGEQVELPAPSADSLPARQIDSRK